jgi:hypothetical protein
MTEPTGPTPPSATSPWRCAWPRARRPTRCARSAVRRLQRGRAPGRGPARAAAGQAWMRHLDTARPAPGPGPPGTAGAGRRQLVVVFVLEPAASRPEGGAAWTSPPSDHAHRRAEARHIGLRKRTREFMRSHFWRTTSRRSSTASGASRARRSCSGGRALLQRPRRAGDPSHGGGGRGAQGDRRARRAPVHARASNLIRIRGHGRRADPVGLAQPRRRGRGLRLKYNTPERGPCARGSPTASSRPPRRSRLPIGWGGTWTCPPGHASWASPRSRWSIPVTTTRR